jgi:hypothetical protein
MFHCLSNSLSAYISARDTRISCAMAFYREHEARQSEERDRRDATRICEGALGAYLLMPFAMLLFDSPTFGFVLLGAGLLFSVVGSYMFALVDRSAGKTLALCFAKVDKTYPTLIKTMHVHRHSGLYEEWSGETV